MITYKTFSLHRGVTPKGVTKAQDEVRAQSKAFISATLKDEDVVAITESALPSSWSLCLVSVTVWYRQK